MVSSMRERFVSPSVSPNATHFSSLYTPSWSSFPVVQSGGWVYTTLALIASLLVLEQVVYRYKKRHLPGDRFTIPIIGRFVNSLYPSVENYCKQWQSGELSVVSVFNIFIVMASTNEASRKILNSPNYTEPCLVHSARKVLLSSNWVFLNGKDHLDYRKGLNHLFTRKALGTYVNITDTTTKKHYARWLKEAAEDPSEKPRMMPIRHLNMEVSLRVFCGQHIPEHAALEISEKYWAITRALELVNFPLAIPGTKVYKAIQARKVAMYWLELAAGRSKAAMAKGGEPECMLDEWVRYLGSSENKGRADFSDLEMAMVIFSFLFASQDAMSSGLVYGLQHLVDNPDILAKVRQEQEKVRHGDYAQPITLEMLDEMTYLKAVVKESLRTKPPVTMVPYKAKKAFPITDDYTVPANSMVIPSLWTSLQDPNIYPDPEKFDPERWLDPESSANVNSKYYMVWGAGAHRCIGTEYAQMNIAIGLATAAYMLNMEHKVTSESYLIEMIATIFPKDGLRLKISPRLEA